MEIFTEHPTDSLNSIYLLPCFLSLLWQNCFSQTCLFFIFQNSKTTTTTQAVHTGNYSSLLSLTTRQSLNLVYCAFSIYLLTSPVWHDFIIILYLDWSNSLFIFLDSNQVFGHSLSALPLAYSDACSSCYGTYFAFILFAQHILALYVSQTLCNLKFQ